MKKKNIFLVKFTVVAAMVGFFSPSVNVKTSVQSSSNFNEIPLHFNVSLLNKAEARGNRSRASNRGGSRARSGPATRPSTRPANRPSTRPANRPSTRPVQRPTQPIHRPVQRPTQPIHRPVQRPTQPIHRPPVNINRNVNVNVNHRYYGGYGHGYGYYGDRAIYGFAAGLLIGTMVAAATMPATCTTVVANGISYRRCGSSYYQPFYQGDTLVYKVVASPY